MVLPSTTLHHVVTMALHAHWRIARRIDAMGQPQMARAT